MAKQTSRRNFLRTAPVAAAVGFTLTDAVAAMAQGAALPTAQSAAFTGADVAGAAQPFKLWPANELASDLTALDAKPGDNRLYEAKTLPVQIVLTVEKHKSAAEFEWHEGRDHILQVIDGSTHYEIGGTPTGTKAMAPGEWHSTGSTGSKSITLGKGDVLLIPRGTLHKRSTEDSVAFLLISNPAPGKT